MIINYYLSLKNKIFISILFTFCTFSPYAQMPSTNWYGALQLNDTIELPVHFYINPDNIVFQNGDEKIYIDEVIHKEDSIIFRMPVFDSEFRCKITGDKMNGYFYNYARKNKNIIPFHAEHGSSISSPPISDKPLLNISGRYHVVFDDEVVDSKDAVGIFTQNGINLTGTFLTTTGDYRYLSGKVDNGRIWLSTFDGSHLFVFTALIKNDSLVNGEFFSGQHWHGTWKGRKNEYAKLLSADSLTFLKTGYEKIDFIFPDENGRNVSLTDSKFKNKAVIIQLMGTWCPNCMDETKFLSEWYNKNRKKNIEIIALDYERFLDTTTVNKNIRRLKKRFDVNYPILFAGSSDKKEASLTLPMLNRVFAFPTTIYLNKEKKVIKIHAGFSGPATGEEYEKFIEWFENLTDQIK